MSDAAGVTWSDAAAMLEVSVGTVSQLVARGALARNQDGRVTMASIRARRAHLAQRAEHRAEQSTRLKVARKLLADDPNRSIRAVSRSVGVPYATLARNSGRPGRKSAIPPDRLESARRLLSEKPRRSVREVARIMGVPRSTLARALAEGDHVTSPHADP